MFSIGVLVAGVDMTDDGTFHRPFSDLLQCLDISLADGILCVPVCGTRGLPGPNKVSSSVPLYSFRRRSHYSHMKGMFRCDTILTGTAT